VAQHRPTGSETTPTYGPQSSRFGSEPPSVEDDVDVWCYAIVRVARQKRRRRRIVNVTATVDDMTMTSLTSQQRQQVNNVIKF